MDTKRRPSLVEVRRKNDGVLRVEDSAVRRMSEANPDIAQQTASAKQATQNEHDMSIRDAIKLYPKAIMFSLALSLAVVMEGYDLSLMGSFFGFPPFTNRYGTETDPENPGSFVISAPWQSGLTNGVQVGSIVGLYLNGWVSEKIGYKKTMYGALLLMASFICLPFFAPNIETILAGAVLQGIPWGVFQTLSTTYASEVMPVALRAYMTTYVNLCWVFGQLIAAGVIRGFLSRTDQWAYRIPFAIQWFWIVPVLIGTLLAPESPWWLVRQGRLEDAKKSILALTSRNTGVRFDADEQVSMIKATNDLEMAMSSGTSYFQCFKGIDARRTEITSMTWVTQAFCGAALMGYSVQFYLRGGLTPENTFNMNIGQYAMGAVGTMLSWFLMAHVGRRKLYLAGLFVMLVLLVIVGGCGVAPTGSSWASWTIGSLLLVYTFVYDLTVGPVCYSLVTEIPSTRLKVKTVVLARNFYNMAGIINNIIMPRMLGLNSWNWGAKTGFFWAGACFLLLTWTYFRLPEPKDRTYGELDVLFENKVSARKFASTEVDQFAGENTEIKIMDSNSSQGSFQEKTTFSQSE